MEDEIKDAEIIEETPAEVVEETQDADALAQEAKGEVLEPEVVEPTEPEEPKEPEVVEEVKPEE